jgi:hypothetical protein
MCSWFFSLTGRSIASFFTRLDRSGRSLLYAHSLKARQWSDRMIAWEYMRKKHEKVVTVSRDRFFAEGQNSIKISTFCTVCALKVSKICDWLLLFENEMLLCRGLQRDVAYLGWPIAPSYMSPNVSEGGSCGVSANEYSCPSKLWRSNSKIGGYILYCRS